MTDRPALFLLQRDDDLADFDVDTASGSVIDVGDEAVHARGEGLTWCGANWPNGEPGASDTFRVGALGRNGRFSGWSDPIDVTVPWVTTLSCASSPQVDPGSSNMHGAAAIAIAIAILARRRRSRPSAT